MKRDLELDSISWTYAIAWTVVCFYFNHLAGQCVGSFFGEQRNRPRLRGDDCGLNQIGMICIYVCVSIYMHVYIYLLCAYVDL